MYRTLMGTILAVGLLLLPACAGHVPPGTTPTVTVVGEYGVRITKATEQLQQILAASTLSDDVKAQGMVAFAKAGAMEERLGRALKIYDEAIKAGQPPPSDGDGRIDNIIALAEQISALVLGAVPNLGEYRVTLDLIQQAVAELKKQLGRM